MFFYVYILKSLKDRKFYVGCTNNLKKRLEEHNGGRVFSTKGRRPFDLTYFEACKNRYDVEERERFFKTGWGRRYIKNKLKNYLKSIKT